MLIKDVSHVCSQTLWFSEKKYRMKIKNLKKQLYIMLVYLRKDFVTDDAVNVLH